MRAPLDSQHHVMRRDAAFIALVAHSFIDKALHALDELRGGESGFWLDSAAEPAVDDAAHSFEDATQEAFRQCFLAFPSYSLLILELAGIVSVSHEYSIRVFSFAVHDAFYPKSHKEAQKALPLECADLSLWPKRRQGTALQDGAQPKLHHSKVQD